ncbi:MAG: glycosyltransferase [Candidatus Tectomicrobia bacterium]|nr:glycosyltransferase [Candidatus Tectomicrobia bacterium]
MKILVVTPDIPPHPLTNGRWLMIHNLFNLISQRHEVFLLCLLHSKDALQHLGPIKEHFSSIVDVAYGNKSQTKVQKLRNILFFRWKWLAGERFPERTLRFQGVLREIIKKYEIDLIHAFDIGIGWYLHDFVELPRILDLTDSSSFHLKRQYALEKSQLSLFAKVIQKAKMKLLERVEGWMVTRFEVSIVVSKDDARHLQQRSPGASIESIPLGVDCDYFSPRICKESPNPLIIFSGAIYFPPNLDAVNYFYYEIFPFIRQKVPGAHFMVVGKNPPQEIRELGKDSDVTVTGYVEDIRPYIAQGTVVICPMRTGAGIKIKLLEALALEKAVVSTSIGASGLDLKDHEHLLIADDKVAFADRVVALLNDPSMRQKLARQGRRWIKERYSWEAAAEHYEILYTDLLMKRKER